MDFDLTKLQETQLTKERRFRAQVQMGIDQIARGEEMDARVARMLRA